MENLLIFLYIFIAFQANQYLRRHLLGQVAVIYSNTGYYYLKEISLAMVLGIITIPIAIIVFIFRCLFSGSKN